MYNIDIYFYMYKIELHINLYKIYYVYFSILIFYNISIYKFTKHLNVAFK